MANMRALRDTLCIAFNDVSVDIAGAYRIKCDGQFRVIGGERADHPDHAMFGGAIGMCPLQSAHPGDG